MYCELNDDDDDDEDDDGDDDDDDDDDDNVEKKNPTLNLINQQISTYVLIIVTDSNKYGLKFP